MDKSKGSKNNKIIAYNKAKFNFKNFKTFAIYNGPVNMISWSPKNRVDVLILPIDKLTNTALSSYGNDQKSFTSNKSFSNSPYQNSPYQNSPLIFEKNKNNLGMYNRESDAFIFKGVKMIIGFIDITRFIQKYSKPSSFARLIKHNLKPIVKDFNIKPDGIAIFGLPELRLICSEEECIEFIEHLRGYFQNVILIADVDDLAIFKKVRDTIDGAFLKSSIFFPDGSQKTRHDLPTAGYLDYLTELKNEINNKADFMVFDVEVLPPFVGNHKEYILMHKVIEWIGQYNFLGSVVHTNEMNDPKDVRPLAYLKIADDNVFEYVNSEQIKKTKKAIEGLVLKLDPYEYPITPATWEPVLNAVNFPPIIGDRFKNITNVKREDFSDTIFPKPIPPKVPLIAELQKVTQNETGEVGTRKPRAPIQRPTRDNLNLGGSLRIHHSVSFKNRKNKPVVEKEKVYNITRVTGMNYVGISYDMKRTSEINMNIARVLFRLLTKKLLSPVRYSIDVPSNEYTPAFNKMIDTLDEMIEKPSRCIRYMENSVFKDKNITSIFQQLKDDLLNNKVEVLTVTSGSLRLIEENPLPYKPVIAIGGETQEEPNTLYIFVSETVPNVLEAVIHIYCKQKYVFSTQQCVIMESAVVGQTQKKCKLPISERIIWQLENLSYSEKIDLVRRTQKVIDTIEHSKVAATNKHETLYAVEIAKYVKQYCNYLLIKKQNYQDRLIQATYEGFLPTSVFEEELAQFIAWATLDPIGPDLMNEYCRCIEKVVTDKYFKSDSPYSVCLCYLFYAFWKGCRRVAWMNLYSSLLDINSLYLEDSDQVAVGMEMTTTQSNMNFLYDLNSHQLSKAMHTLLRSRGKRIPLGNYENQLNQTYTESDHKAKTIANAFIFVYPVLVDLLLIKFLGSGIFVSSNISEGSRNCISLVLLIIFPIVGGIINSIARTCTYYFFQKSMPLMLESFSKRLSSALIIVTIASSILAGIAIFISKDPVYGNKDDFNAKGYTLNYYSIPLTFFYAMGFCLYLIFFSILTSIKNPEIFFLKCEGPRSAIIGVCILLIPMLCAKFILYPTTNDPNYQDKNGKVDEVYRDRCIVPWKSNLAWAIYDVAFFVSVFYMSHMFKKIAHDYIDWPSKLKIPTEEEIQSYFETSHPRPKPFPNEPKDVYDKRILLWNRAARQYYMKEVLNSIHSPSFKSQPAIIKQRVTQERWEMELMQWFFLRTGTTIYPEKYSNQWDTMVKGGIIDLKKKYQIEKLNRGDLLFQFESPAIYFGVFYFIFIFIDKWAMFIMRGKPVIAIDTTYVNNFGINNLYVNATLFATMFMLISSGFLEITLNSLLKYEMENSIQVRMNTHKGKEMFASFKNNSRKIYRTELIKFLTMMFVVLMVIMGVYLFNLSDSAGMLTIYLFLFVTLGFCGFLLGLFHKLFFKSQDTEVLLNKIMLVIIVVTIAIPSIARLFTRQNSIPWFVGITTSLGGVFFGIACMWLYFRETYSNVHYTTTLAPHLASSGQRFINDSHDSLAIKTLNTFCQIKAPKTKIHLSSQSHQLIINKMNYFLEQFSYLPDTHILRLAFPKGKQILSTIVHDLSNGKIQVFFLPEQHFDIAGHRYTAVSRMNENILEVYTFEKQTMGLVTDVINDEVATWVCSSIVHEFCEQVFGYTHANACACEYLCYPADRVLKVLPSRYDYQIKNCTDYESRKMFYNTDNITLQKGLFDIKVDVEWPRLSRESRVWLIRWMSDLERVMSEFDLNSYQFNINKIKTFLNNIPPNLLATIHKYNNPGADIRELVAMNIISIYNSRLILQNLEGATGFRVGRRNNMPKKKTRYSFIISYKTLQPFKSKVNANTMRGTTIRRSQREIESEKPSFLENLSIKLKEYELLFFLAFTGDPRFGRELSSMKIFFLIKFILVRFFKIARRLSWFITKNFYLKHKSETINLMRQMKDGLFRTHFVGGGRLLRVDSYNSSAETLVSLMEFRDGYMIANRYTGPRALTWKPGSNDIPVSRGYFNIKSRQLLYEQDLDKKGNIVQTKVYVYKNREQQLPVEAYYVEKDIKLSENHAQNQKYLKKRIFYDQGENHRISTVILRVKQEKTGENIDVYATYVYEKASNNAITHPIPKYISYKCTQLNWSMVTFYATGYKIENPTLSEDPKFSRIEFRRLNNPNVVYITTFDYSHPQNTKTNTVLFSEVTNNYVQVETPYEVANDPLKILSGIPSPSFYANNEVLTYKLKSRKDWISHKKVKRISYFSAKYSTSLRRQELWTYWRANKIEGVFARDFDEHLLREEKVLKKYWKYRDRGNKAKAVEALTKVKHILDVVLVVTDRPTTRTNLHLKYSDLEILGTGGDGTEIGRQSESENDDSILPVMNLDSGTWPTGGGGVGSCRRDLIDYLEHIRWHSLVEIGSAEAVQRDYQIERNIASITYLPLWDVDFSSPDENIYRKLDYRSLCRKKMHTKDEIVTNIFSPIIYQLIYACMDEDLTNDKLKEYEELFVDLYLYFQKCDWTISWNHIVTQRTWICTWLEVSEQKLKEGKLIDMEMPTLKEIDMLFSLINRLLFPLSAKLDKVPVVHASHHGIQAILGVIAKAINGSTLIVWDHGILWRERLFGLCSSDDMPKFVQIGFVGLTRLVSRLVYANADYITPCTSIQNVTWEQWLGGGKYGDDSERQRIARNIYPVVNGMNVARFNPRPELENQSPLAVMLSHISPVKDIHNAIHAADVIVNDLHITNYTLHIYGSKEKDAAYAVESQNLINSLNLQNNVILQGLGNPSNVLPTGWVFVNSSITEGLPLALGEAGLCGLPVVCTDVGGSREVISNLETGVVYGSIVPPQKARQLALGQLRVLTMTDGLEQLIDPQAPLIKLEELLARGPQAVEQRMCHPMIKEKRRKLGLLLRQRTIDTFSIAKYWRQHEQVLWLGYLYKN
jgi:glycosyltransferase involved in cell wall biosynthesis